MAWRLTRAFKAHDGTTVVEDMTDKVRIGGPAARPSNPWAMARFDRLYLDRNGTTHILDGASGHSVTGGFHIGNRQGCVLCREGGHWHNCHEVGCVSFRFRQPEAKSNG